MKYRKIIYFLLLISPVSHAADFHSVGWINTFLPGAGSLGKAAIEVGTFGLGYSWSTHQNFDLDGAKGNNSSQLLQEVGMKYHMLNVFESYRDEYLVSGGDVAQGLDQRPTLDLFKDPFDPNTLSSPFVWVPLAISAGAIAVDYQSTIHHQSALPKQSFGTNLFSGFNQITMYPIGSGAPEEMFYRGFLQNEFYHWVASPFFSIPLSAAAFAFSHGPDVRAASAVSGAYLGFLAYRNQGKLNEGIAIHFWTVVMLGVESLFLMLHAQNASQAPPVSAQFIFNI